MIKDRRDEKPRKCLKCQKVFESKSPANRICYDCRNVKYVKGDTYVREFKTYGKGLSE
mgnify:CR=1 FL=1